MSHIYGTQSLIKHTHTEGARRKVERNGEVSMPARTRTATRRDLQNVLETCKTYA